MADDLSAPLGQKKQKFSSAEWRKRLPQLPWGRIMVAVLLLVILIGVARIALVEDPDGGRPVADVQISTTKDNNPIAHETVDVTPETMIVSDAEADESGAAAPTPQPAPDAGTPAEPQAGPPTNEFDLYLDMLEETKYGTVPRISPAGVTPFEAYARPSISPASASGKALVALVVSGLGINENATLDAIDRLPENITLGFAPYGDALDRLTFQARRQGHEILVEVPMEPFDYPQSDPGPRTLLTNQPARTNLDHLFWLMSRFGGYVGMMNNLGARFTASAVDFTPIMEELGTRGLAYLDDNSSNRSLSRQLATANQVPYARAAVTLDITPSRAAILERLDELVAQAEANGSAIGIATALPVSINTLTSWAAGLDDANVVLVPVSALMSEPSN